MDNFEDFERMIMDRFGWNEGTQGEESPEMTAEVLRIAMEAAEERLRIMQQTMSLEAQLRELHGDVAVEGLEELWESLGIREPEKKMSEEDAYLHRLGI